MNGPVAQDWVEDDSVLGQAVIGSRRGATFSLLSRDNCQTMTITFFARRSVFNIAA